MLQNYRRPASVHIVPKTPSVKEETQKIKEALAGALKSLPLVPKNR
jgi:hypothetical protein